jgi:hypothetical protein
MLAGAPAAANETLQVGYSIRLLGLSLGSAGMNAKISQSSYDLEISAQLSGIASIVSKAHGGARSSGSIEQGRVLSRAYATASSNSKETRTVRMALNAGSVRSVELVPPPEPHPDRVPVTDAHKRGIVDPLSALVMPVAGANLIDPRLRRLRAFRHLAVLRRHATGPFARLFRPGRRLQGALQGHRRAP